MRSWEPLCASRPTTKLVKVAIVGSVLVGQHVVAVPEPIPNVVFVARGGEEKARMSVGEYEGECVGE